MRELETDREIEEAYSLLREAMREMRRGRAKYTSPNHMLHAAICEFFELHKEVLKAYMLGDQRRAAIREELVQTIGTLLRLYFEGDPSVRLAPICAPRAELGSGGQDASQKR